MKEFWEWATVHYLLAFFIIYAVIFYIFKIFNRLLRSINILIRGWPNSSYMDADGDIVFPKQDQKRRNNYE